MSQPDTKLSYDQLHHHICSEAWTTSFDPTTLMMAKKWLRKCQLDELRLESLETGDLELTATLTDPLDKIEQSIASFWLESGQVMQDCSCSCDMQSNCAHAAVLMSYLSKGQRLRQLMEKNAMETTADGQVDSQAMQSWLDELQKQSASNAPAQQLEKPASKANECILYLIQPDEHKPCRAALHLFHGSYNKNGQLSQKFAAAQNLPSLADSADENILHLLSQLKPVHDDSLENSSWMISGPYWNSLLAQLIKTNRLVIKADKLSPLAIGQRRDVSLSWHEENQSLQPVAQTQPASQHFLYTDKVYYIDTQQSELGLIESSQPAELIHAWLNGPSIPLDSADELIAESESRGLTATLPELPAAASHQKKNLIDPSAAQFHLRVERRPQTAKHLPEIYALAGVSYGEHTSALTASQNMKALRIKTAEGVQHIARDHQAEISALQQLQQAGLHPGLDKSNPFWAPEIDAPNELTDTVFWTSFRHQIAPQLEQAGWHITYAHNVGNKPLVFKSTGWKAEIVEEGRGWFTLSAGFEIEGEQFDIQPILAALLENKFLERTKDQPAGQEFLCFLPDGRAVALPVGRFRKILTTLEMLLEFQFPDKPIKIQKLEAAALADDDELELEVPAEIADLATQIASLDAIPDIQAPRGLDATLRPYQLEGFRWMTFLSRQQLCGILADDMGLGKTLQTIAYILSEKENGHSCGLPNLVLAPTSVVQNWQREAAKFAPDLEVLILQGADRHQRFEQMSQADIVMSSYALLARDLEYFIPQKFHAIILDEAQHIKNPQAKVSQALLELDSNHRLCLSGTPIENHLGELWSLMRFLMPGLLGSQEKFNESYRKNIEAGSQAHSDALNRKVGPLILRRTKDEVATELPPKTEIVHSIALNPAQKDLYETVRSTMDKKVRRAIAMAGGGESQIVFLAALLKLRQICCHPDLIAESHEPLQSEKFNYLADLLATLKAENRKVLLFSQFTSMLDLIEAHVIEQNMSYLKLTGGTKNRHELVDIFQRGETDIFLISLKAGGTGLTLTAADTVIHYDPWWNPASENQATDRAYRIGQDKPVFVHKLICAGTVEERIQQMQGKKNTLANNLLDGATKHIQLTADTMQSLLSE